ncbi:MAG: molybdenum cofactor guanylyltransferase [Firmicutes bacterium]|nr:molybdenum cofactor guanylyltransferase [Alicyclobacillaceae bacterium]MCL6496349.1 molybdenum cofactor guanylyltransferase [Bacillota bacterium]
MSRQRLVDCDGVVLAGGRSRRMGEDKYRLPWPGGPTLGAFQVRRLASAVAGAVWVARGAWARPHQHPEELPDPIVEGGPLAGILAALERTRARRVAVLAVDLPGAAPEAFWVLDAAGVEFAVAKTEDGVLQPLVGLWPRNLAESLRRYLEAGGRRVGEYARAQGAWAVAMPAGVRLDNLNTPQDWRRWQERITSDG